MLQVAMHYFCFGFRWVCIPPTKTFMSFMIFTTLSDIHSERLLGGNQFLTILFSSSEIIKNMKGKSELHQTRVVKESLASSNTRQLKPHLEC